MMLSPRLSPSRLPRTGGVPRRTMRKPRRVAGGVLGALWKLLKSSLH